MLNYITFFILAITFVAIVPKFFDYIALNPTNVFENKYFWTFFTSMFMHAPGGAIPFLSFHLLINMLVLFNLGSMMERIVGKKRFLWFYLISGLVAGSTGYANVALMPAMATNSVLFAMALVIMFVIPRANLGDLVAVFLG